ncbi:hypothetical protein ACO2Q3_18900 [Caulobacter sp. KR2-114]|uniref:hypothetical protein n=1 Tax=Caulobacter sp. KR2-114 TaxID=3400912 RepID=UPI003C0ABD72
MPVSKPGRSRGIARRTLFASLAIAATTAPAAQGAVLAECAAWLALELEIDRLAVRWAALEAFAARNSQWFSLTPEQRLALPGAAEMAAIDTTLERLSSERERQLEALHRLRSRTLHDVASRLAVAARLMQHEEHPAQPLVDKSLRELARLKCPGCGMRYLPADLAAR